MRLTDLLWKHFFEGQMSGIERRVGGESGSNEAVAAFESLKLSPYYTFQSEDGTHTSATESVRFQV